MDNQTTNIKTEAVQRADEHTLHSPEPVFITANCPVRKALQVAGGKWKLLILYQLAENPKRFNQIKKLIPDISERMLAKELKDLCDRKLVSREQFKESPPRVEYSLTEAGYPWLVLIEELAMLGKSQQDLCIE